MAETKMTQSAIIRELAESCEISNKVAKQFMEQFATMAVRETKKNGVFVIPGIGRLVRSERKARMGRNPTTARIGAMPIHRNAYSGSCVRHNT